MAVSIGDVAKRAEVSISTVSRVVNGSKLVNPVTRARVQTAIDELGYRPNALARGLMLRRSEIIGLILPDLHGEFYSEIIRGANMQARDAGYSLLISSSRPDDDGASFFASSRQRSLLDGAIVMLPDVTDQSAGALADMRIPFVLLDDDIPATRHDSVIIDQRAGAAKLMRHLVNDRKVRRIIFIGGLKTNVDTRERLHACRETLAAFGSRIADTDIHYLDYSFEKAYRFARDTVREWIGPATCVFAANDEMAAGILTAAMELGLTIPGDLGVVGFDDTRIARLARPALTTVRVPMADMGARAVELLCRRMADPNTPPTQIKLEPQLVVRDSCKVPTQ